ncbi:MAG: DUF1275 domain-containing protein [Burkholderiales bacterium]|nr:MAG: DUF1275 domain-containing protein [Burkholderiales bacterium]
MISKFPRWVWTGAWTLAFIAGIVNVVGLLGFEHEAVTHLTGNTSLLAGALATLDLPAALRFASIIGSFVAGAVISGLVIQDTRLQLGRRYGAALLLVSLLLFVSVPLLGYRSAYGMYTAACAMGLQNAMVSTYSGAVVRTSHVSGMFTDLGIFLGHALRGFPVDSRRLRLCLLVISGFFCGGVAGTFAFQAFAYFALLFPASITALASIAYGLYRIGKDRSKPVVGDGA